MTRLAPIIALCASPAFACDLRPDGAAVILGTHHVNAQRTYDEGIAPRGVALTWRCETLEAGAAAFRNSFGNAGFSFSATSDRLTLGAGGIEVTPTLGWNYYPEQETQALRDSNGFFPMAGLQVSYGHAWLRWYPSAVRDGADSFDSLLVAGFGWRF